MKTFYFILFYFQIFKSIKLTVLLKTHDLKIPTWQKQFEVIILLTTSAHLSMQDHFIEVLGILKMNSPLFVWRKLL